MTLLIIWAGYNELVIVGYSDIINKLRVGYSDINNILIMEYTDMVMVGYSDESINIGR